MSPVALETKQKGKKISVSLMIMYAFWRFLLSSTVWSVSGLVYVAFVFLTLSLCYTVYKLGKIFEFSISAAICLPFIVYTIFQYGISFNFEAASYWMDCLLLIIIAANTNFPHTIPKNLLIISGGIVSIGIFVQILFPDFYYSNVATIFTSYTHIKYWGSVMNYAGFTYQLGQSAFILIMAEGAVLYLYRKKLNRFWTFPIALLFIALIFLTGKRMLSVISIMVPLVIYCFSGKSLSKRVKRFFIIALVIFCGLFVVISNIDYLASTNIGIFTRFADALEQYKQGESIASSRMELIQTALEAFRSNPVFGIGAGNFISNTGAEMEVHNAYIQTLCESGIVGFSFFMVMLLYYLLKTIVLLCKSNDKGYLQFSLFTQLVFIINAFTENGTRNLEEFILYFVAIGICIYEDMQVKRAYYQGREKAEIK